MPADSFGPVARPRGPLLAGLCLALTAVAAPAAAQRNQSDATRAPNEFTLSAGPAAGSLRYLRTVARSVELGVELNAGPVYGVVISDDGLRDIREWTSGFLEVALRPAAGVRAFLSPIGVTGIVGNDFGTVYPSAQAGLDLDVGPVRFTTTLRVVRVAGGNGTGDYLVQWLPIRLGYAFVW